MNDILKKAIVSADLSKASDFCVKSDVKVDSKGKLICVNSCSVQQRTSDESG